MKILGLVLFSAVIFTSCNSSVKGNWSENDMERCIKDGEDELKEDDELKTLVGMYTDNESDFVQCVCQNMEKDFESYYEADKAVNDEEIAEEEGMKIFMKCFGLQDLLEDENYDLQDLLEDENYDSDY